MLAERTFAYTGAMQAVVASMANEDGMYSTADLMDPDEEDEEPEEEDEDEMDPIMTSIPMEPQ